MRLGYGFINFLVFLDPSEEIALRDFPRVILVVGVPAADLQCDIGGDHSRVVAKGFEENKYQPFFLGNSGFDLRSMSLMNR